MREREKERVGSWGGGRDGGYPQEKLISLGIGSPHQTQEGCLAKPERRTEPSKAFRARSSNHLALAPTGQG